MYPPFRVSLPESSWGRVYTSPTRKAKVLAASSRYLTSRWYARRRPLTVVEVERVTSRQRGEALW
jgi:hypothetical protein